MLKEILETIEINEEEDDEMVDVDLFGIKFNKVGNSDERKGRVKITEIHITRKELLEALGYKEEEVKFISYDYKTGILMLRTG